MEIMGFHNDGGFADFVIAPGESLIPIPDNITPLTACFAEPMGCVFNACPDPEAFGMGISKAGKGSRYVFFSTLAKDKALDTNLLNLVHYREISLVGAYGLTCQNMVDALAAMEEHQNFLAMLVQQIIPLDRVDSIMPAVLSGVGFKYVVDFRTSDETN
jgi:nicotinate-nucleotide--dimethylbenzimidazole phosphoribosyltransferase